MNDVYAPHHDWAIIGDDVVGCRINRTAAPLTPGETISLIEGDAGALGLGEAYNTLSNERVNMWFEFAQGIELETWDGTVVPTGEQWYYYIVRQNVDGLAEYDNYETALAEFNSLAAPIREIIAIRATLPAPLASGAL